MKRSLKAFLVQSIAFKEILAQENQFGPIGSMPTERKILCGLIWFCVFCETFTLHTFISNSMSVECLDSAGSFPGAIPALKVKKRMKMSCRSKSFRAVRVQVWTASICMHVYTCVLVARRGGGE